MPADRLSRFFKPKLMVPLVLLVTLLLTVSSLSKKSVTVDEFAFLPKGLSVLKYRSFEMDPGTAPLPETLAAVPVKLFTQVEVRQTTNSSIWEAGSFFQMDHPEKYHDYFIVGRYVTVAVFLAGCLLTFGFCRSLYGNVGAVVALVVVCFSPDMMAHGSLITADAYLAASVVASLWALHLFLQRPNWKYSLLLGTALGIASVCKLTGFLLIFIFMVGVLLLYFVRRFKAVTEAADYPIGRATFGFGMVAILTAVLVINSLYLFDRSFTTMRNFSFQTSLFQSVQKAMPGWLPVPLPAMFVQGFDTQTAEPKYDAYLLGKFNETGFRNYYLVGFLVKTPEPILLLLLLAVLLKPKLRLCEIPLLVTALAYFLLFSFCFERNIGVRYLLFLVPLAAIFSGRIVHAPAWSHPRLGRWIRTGTAAALVCLVLINVLIFPDYLAYFNQTSGGPDCGHKYLLDSNLDWGQDLLTLRRYMEKEQIDSVDLAYFGRVDPSIYGIKYTPMLRGVSQRYSVISANLLWGRMYYVNGSDIWPADRDHYAVFRTMKPKAILGHTLYVFDNQRAGSN